MNIPTTTLIGQYLQMLLIRLAPAIALFVMAAELAYEAGSLCRYGFHYAKQHAPFFLAQLDASREALSKAFTYH